MQKEIRIRPTHFLLAALPLALSPLVLFALAEGWVDLGGGEKDIVLAFPYALWALVFSFASIVLILKRWPILRWITRAGVVSAGLMVVLTIVAFIAGWLGVS